MKTKSKNKPITIQLDENTKALIEFLKSENESKFGPPTTTQIITYAIQLAACEHARNCDDTVLFIQIEPFICYKNLRAILEDRIVKVRFSEEDLNVFGDDDDDDDYEYFIDKEVLRKLQETY